MLLPFLLKRLEFALPTSSAPFVATLVGMSGLIIPCSAGSMVRRGTLF